MVGIAYSSSWHCFYKGNIGNFNENTIYYYNLILFSKSITMAPESDELVCKIGSYYLSDGFIKTVAIESFQQ